MSFILLGILNSQAAGAGVASDYELLETTELASSASSVTFSGLGSYTDYKHLQIRMTIRSDRSNTLDTMYFQANADTGTNYSWHYLRGNGSSVSSFGEASQSEPLTAFVEAGLSATDSFSGQVMDILDFSNTNKNTTLRILSGITGNATIISLNSVLWNDTSAVTSLLFSPVFGTNFVAGSRFSLYGIKG